MIEIEDLRMMNEATMIYRKNMGLDTKRNELVSEIIADDACFFKIEKQDAYMLLEEIGVGKEKIAKVYNRMICQDEYLKLEKERKNCKRRFDF